MRYAAILCLMLAIESAASAEPQWEEFGAWKVAAVHSDMDPTTHVIVRTIAKEVDASPVVAGLAPLGDFYVGFRIFGGTLVTLDVDFKVSGKNYWPFCDFDNSSYRIDDSPVAYIPSRDDAGSCDDIVMTPKFLSQLRAGRSIKLKLNGTVAEASLQGFSAAWARADQLARKR